VFCFANFKTKNVERNRQKQRGIQKVRDRENVRDGEHHLGTGCGKDEP